MSLSDTPAPTTGTPAQAPALADRAAGRGPAAGGGRLVGRLVLRRRPRPDRDRRLDRPRGDRGAQLELRQSRARRLSLPLRADLRRADGELRRRRTVVGADGARPCGGAGLEPQPHHRRVPGAGDADRGDERAGGRRQLVAAAGERCWPRGRAERLSVAANDYSLAEGGTTLFSARHAELHVRHHPGEAAGTLDIAAGFKGAAGVAPGAPVRASMSTSPGTRPAVTLAAAPAASTVDAEFEATVTGVPPFRSMPPAQRLLLIA